MKKVHVVNRQYEVNLDHLAKHVEILESPEGADFFLCRNTVPPEVPRDRTILILVEPPLTGHRIDLYSRTDEFHTVIGYRELPNIGNVFNLWRDPSIMPYNPYAKADLIREDTTLSTRRIYFAGQVVSAYMGVPDCFGSVNMYPLRHLLGWSVIRHDMGYCVGRGWPKVTKSYSGQPVRNVLDSWRLQKQADCAQGDIDFVLCLENSSMPGYLTEKFHDGMMLDRVMLYLGEPNVVEYVPRTAFVDLRQYWNRYTYKFDVLAMLDRVATMTQDEYDNILHNARTFRVGIQERHEAERIRTTDFVLERMEA